MTEKVVESDIFKIINNRRSIRKFIDKDIPDEVSEKFWKQVSEPLLHLKYAVLYILKTKKR
ncbi:MAG: hypothetical protein ACTSQX_12675 [Candidatus Heimdallarchaeota archaeon]